jgi:hypothetical protein
VIAHLNELGYECTFAHGDDKKFPTTASKSCLDLKVDGRTRRAENVSSRTSGFQQLTLLKDSEKRISSGQFAESHE